MPSVVSQPTATMPTSNDALSKRRRFQYQPAITNFFSSQRTEPHLVDGKAVSHNHYAAATFSATPVVSEKVQSSLLSVGMRVRKAVADGYMTERSLKQEKAIPPIVVQTPTAPEPMSTYNSAELAPFSGIPKTPYDPSGHIVTDDGDNYSLPPSSQESVASTSSFRQKRSFDDWEDENNTTWQNAPADRHILAPGLGQQRRRLLALQRNSQPSMDVDDFEEASFLRRREEVDADYADMDYY